MLTGQRGPTRYLVWRCADIPRPWGFDLGRNGHSRNGDEANLAIGVCSVCGAEVYYQRICLDADMKLVCWHCE